MRSVFLTCAARLAGCSASATATASRRPADHAVDQAGDALALLAQLEQQRDGGLAVAGHERVGERPDLALGRAWRRTPRPRRRRCSRPGRARARASPARAAAAAGGRRPGRRAPSRPRGPGRAERCRLLGQPLRQIPGLDVDLGGDLAAGRLDRRVRAWRAPCSGPPRGRRTRPSASPGRRPRAPRHRRRRRPPSSARRRRRSRTGARSRTSSRQRAATASGVHGVALVDLDARAAGRGLGHRPQARAPLGDAAVVVAVDEVGGEEGWARLASLEGRRDGSAGRPAAPRGEAFYGCVVVRVNVSVLP